MGVAALHKTTRPGWPKQVQSLQQLINTVRHQPGLSIPLSDGDGGERPGWHHAGTLPKKNCRTTRERCVGAGGDCDRDSVVAGAVAVA